MNRLPLLFILILLFCKTANAQGDEFVEVLNKPKDDPQVLALFAKVNLKFKYGDNGYTHGDTYASEASPSHYNLYAIVGSVVKSITFYHTKEGEGWPCPYALPLGITNTMTVEQMIKIFGTSYESVVESAYTNYSKTLYTYFKGSTKITFNFLLGTTLIATTIAYVYPYAIANYEADMKKYFDILMEVNKKNHPDWEKLIERESHEKVSENVINLEAGYTYRLMVTYDSLTVQDMNAVLQVAGQNYFLTPKMSAFYHKGVWIKTVSASPKILKNSSGQINIQFQNRAKSVAVHYTLFKYKSGKTDESEQTQTQTKVAPVAQFPVGCKVKAIEISKYDTKNYYSDEFTGMAGTVTEADLKPDGNGWFSGKVKFANGKTNHYASAKFEKVK